MRSFASTFTFGLLLGVTSLFGHDTWLQPSRFQTATAQAVSFDLTSGGKYPVPDHAIALERIQVASFRLAGNQAPLSQVGRGANALQLSQSFDREGVATAWVTLHPRPIELTNRTVAQYLDEIHARMEVRATWSRLKRHQAWKETYTKHAKTCLSVGDARADLSWSEPVGQRLEIVPITNPFTARVGQNTSFRLLYQGKPIAGASLGLRHDGRKQAKFQTTDAAGEATFPIEKAGRAMVFSVNLDYREDQGMWVSDFSTLTIDVPGS